MQGQPGWYFWWIGFSLTLLIEAPWVLGLLASGESRWSRRIAALVFANLATHPLVWFFYPAMPLTHRSSLSLSELFAFLAEVVFYATFVSGVTWRRAALVSAMANATSFGIGWFVVRQWGDWLFRL